MRIIACTGFKGGCAKSTTSIHVATYFSDRAKVLLIDCDPNKTCIDWGNRGSLPFIVAEEKKAIRLIPKHDLIVIDTPARPGTDDLKELVEDSDLLILPTMPDILSLQPMLQTAKDLQGIDATAKYRALVCACPPPPNTDGKTMITDLQDAGIPAFKTTIRRTVGFPKAALEGVPIRDLKDSRSRLGWLDYQALGKEIEEIWASSGQQ